MVSVPAPHRRFRVPQACGVCRLIHEFRVYHLALGADGTVIVSPAVYRSIRDRIADQGLAFLNEVTDPPPLQIGPTIIHR